MESDRQLLTKMVQEGAVVVFTDLNKEAAQSVTAKYSKDQAIAVQCDVTSEEGIAEAFKQTILAFGGVDILVHSAGLAISNL